MHVRAPSSTVGTGTKRSPGEDLERNDGSSERPFFMSRELHEILSKTKPDEPDDGSAPVPVQADEETPLQQQAQEDGEIQLKQEAVLRTENEDEEEQQPLTQEQVVTAAAEEGDQQQQQDKTPPPQTPQEPQTQTTEPHTTPLQNGFLDIEPEEKKEPEQAAQPAVAAAEEQEQQAEEEKPKENGPQETDTPLTPQEWAGSRSP